MSIVARQSFKYSLIGYFGFLLGTFSALFIFPQDMVFYGKLRYILPTAEILVPLVVFGLSYSTVKFFLPTHQKRNHQKLLSLSLVGICFNFTLFLGMFYLLGYVFPSFKTTQLWQMKLLILPLILVLALSQVFNKYISNFKRIVIPNIFENLFPKLANLLAFSLFFFVGLTEKMAFGFFLSVFCLSLTGYVFYTNKLESIKPNFSTQFLRKENLWRNILNYSFYGFLGNIGNYIAIKIDGYMIGEYIGFEQNGIYSTLLSIVALINIPQMGVFSISTPIINKCIAENNFKELDTFHKKTSLSLFFIGLVLFSCVLVGFPYLTAFMKNGTVFLENQFVLWVIGFALLFDLATGFNGQIISMSKHYRFSIVVMIFLATNTILLNLYFIKNTQLGILGIAIATAISLTLFNVAKLIFNYQKFKVFPFSSSMFYAFLLAVISVGLVISLPIFSLPIFNLVYKPFLILFFMGIGNYYLKIYPLNQFLNKNFIKSIFKF